MGYSCAIPLLLCSFLLGTSLNSADTLKGSLRTWKARPLLVVQYRRSRAAVVVCATVVSAEQAETFLDAEIPKHPELVIGELNNGLRYVLLPNKTPPDRFEAHLEIHAGSVDEKDDEQGLAHLLEHVAFLGSRKREGLLGTGARSNAYTDFHHTVFHVHSPVTNAATGKRMMPQVLEALEEIAFRPMFLYSRIDKEKRAVLSEAQMMNTMEYRVDCQLLKYLHEENALGRRFPIGKTDQVMGWTAEMLKMFWRNWYFPRNATLYIVGQLEGGPEETKALIEKMFGNVPLPETIVQLPKQNGSNGADNAESSEEVRRRQTKRPPVDHKMGYGALLDGGGPAPVNIFRHPLLQHFMLSIFCKFPVRQILSKRDLKYLLMLRTMISVLQFRINGRYSQQNPPFISIEIDISDSGREGCCVSTLTIISEPRDWRGAVQVALEEVRRLQRHGVKPGELRRYMDALLKDSEQAAVLSDSIPSPESLDYLMESLALNHVVMDQKTQHEIVLEVAKDVKLQEVNALARSMLSFTSDFGRDAEVLLEAEQNPELWAEAGPSRATSIVACVPAFMDESGLSTGGGVSMHRGASMATMEHVESEAMPSVPTLSDDSSVDDFDVPEGAVRFDITEREIAEVLMDQSVVVEAGADVDVPENLISSETLGKLIVDRQPAFVSIPGAPADHPTMSKDPSYGIVQRRLSNGIRINYVHTDNEPQSAVMRLVIPGGKFSDKLATGSDGIGASAVGTRALSESGTVGDWKREQTELFCVSKLINCVLEASDEFLVMDFNFPIGGGGLKAVLQILHLFLQNPKWEEAAVARAKQIYISTFRTQQKSLEHATMRRMYSAMFGTDRRFMDPNPEDIEALTVEGMSDVLSRQIGGSNMEVSIVGDIDPKEVDDLVLEYLGTVDVASVAQPLEDAPIKFNDPQPHQRRQVWHLQDSDERACGYIAGAAPSRWGPLGSKNQTLQPPLRVIPPQEDPESATSNPLSRNFATAIRRAHPLYPSTALMLLTEIVNSRLFTTVRDQLGLTYDVSFDLCQFDRHPGGWFSVHVTSSIQKIHEAVNASIDVLRNIATQTITPRELGRAKRTLITRHESDLRNNNHWIGLLTHLQSDFVPLKTVDCLRDIKAMYHAVTIQDIYDAYGHFCFDDDSIYTCVGTSGKIEPPAPIPPSARGTRNTQQSKADFAAKPVAATNETANPAAFWATILSAAQALGKVSKKDGETSPEGGPA